MAIKAPQSSTIVICTLQTIKLNKQFSTQQINPKAMTSHDVISIRILIYPNKGNNTNSCSTPLPHLGFAMLYNFPRIYNINISPFPPKKTENEKKC